MKTSIGIVLAAGALMVACSPDAAAHGDGSGAKGKDRTAMREAFKACAAEAGIVKGQGKPSDENKAKMRACMEKKGFKRDPAKRKAFREKMKACLEAAGIKRPAEGENPKFDETKKAAFKSCREKVKQELAPAEGSDKNKE